MKYEILIEGGFTGIPKEYKGDIHLKDKTKESLFEAFEGKQKSVNTALRDGFQYHLKLIDGEEEHEARYDEKNLPLPIRQFIATISKKNK
ncbi:hypothetical protein SAMN05421636_104344 [Pricia antarctica]|uniref:Uncharacterized protein n=1 Tax=Pricia antarctica TaxID=641691 RepID=A0A1G7C0P2_9FLAO|nr:hypothetical protein [Pricia antarctica]SDE32005.1 hypothetical protein SAMN05421636_104344 [Pricia antarctica]